MIPHVLAVDDDPKVLDMVREALSRDGYRVACAATAAEAFEQMREFEPDLALLDHNLPDRSGLEICGVLRRDPKTAAMGIIMLTIVSTLNRKVDALDSGADDYLTKPFHIAELRSRVRAVLRRRLPWLVQTQPLTFGRLSLDPSNYKVSIGEKSVALTKAEFEILYLLAVNAGRAVRRDYIEARVLDQDAPGRSLDVHISRLRDKLGSAAGQRIETLRNLGYLFAGDEN